MIEFINAGLDFLAARVLRYIADLSNGSTRFDIDFSDLCFLLSPLTESVPADPACYSLFSNLATFPNFAQ
jgi:hypothetical protein